MTNRYDVAVIGAGVFGAWTAYFLHKAGLRVIMLDAYGPANSRSSSGDESRITRTAYGPNEIYSRWALDSLPEWLALEKRCGRKLFYQTGVLTISDDKTRWIETSCETINRVGGRCETYTDKQAASKFPQVRFLHTESALFEPNGGALMARRAVQLLMKELKDNGVEYRQSAIAPPDGNERIMTLEGDPIFASNYVFACGPWLPKLFPNLLAGYIHPIRAEVFFLGIPAGTTEFNPPAMPAWIYMGAENWDAYGIPNIENRGFKVAVDIIRQSADPDVMDRQTTTKYVQQMRDFIRDRFPKIAHAPIVESRVCQYENTPLHHYLIDRHPHWNNVWLVGGGSGHGFKNGPAIGRYVSELITKNVALEPRLQLTPQ